MDYIKDLHELCETLSRELGDVNEKIRSAGGKMSAGDLEVADKLTHAIKSIKTTIAMIENEDGYSSHYPYYGGVYADGPSRTHGSYRGSYARRRDSMGRYSGERGYSRDGGMVEELRELMQDAPDERTKQEFQRFISKLESM